MTVSTRFVDRTVVVTGAASGIGAATARRFTAEGARVLLADVDETRGPALAEELGNGARFVPCDVAREADWNRLRAAADSVGGADILVGNAAVQQVMPAHDLPVPAWDRQLAVGLTAGFLGVRALIGSIRQHEGCVVLVSSVHALVGLPGHPAYAAAKGGLTALTRQLAVEYGPEVRVNCVLPGPILTPMWDTISQDDRRRSIAQTVAHRFGRPSEVASVITFLASADAGYVTGASLVVDGGWSIMKDSS